MSTIYASRLGFSYQDKMACHLFLKELRKGTIYQFYTDYPIPGTQNSLDILMRIGSEGAFKEKVYEVKTGECFKNDKKSEKSSEVREVVVTFLKYDEISPGFEGFISFSKGLHNGLNSYTSPANVLKINKILLPGVRTAADLLKDQLGISELNTQQKVHKFFKRVSFIEEPYDNDSTWNELDQHIRSEITEIAKTLDLNDRVYELPNEYLASKLLFTIQRFAGSGNDITKELIAEVMEFMSLRKLLGSYTQGGTPDQLKRDAKSYIKTEMINKFKIETLILDDDSIAQDEIMTSASDTGLEEVLDE